VAKCEAGLADYQSRTRRASSQPLPDARRRDAARTVLCSGIMLQHIRGISSERAQRLNRTGDAALLAAAAGAEPRRSACARATS
jgi:hypothetical protein